MTEPRLLPSWAEDLRRRYLRGEASMFVLHGNVYDVILDISGEWDAVIENYGDWKGFGTSEDVFKITQEGNSFVAIRTKGNFYMPAGTAGTRGELDKNGFKRVSMIAPSGPWDAKGQISEDGNKIVIDEGRVMRQILTRK